MFRGLFIFSVLCLLLLDFAFGQALGEKKCVWLFLGQKEECDLKSIKPEDIGISQRAIKRRSKVIRKDILIDELDLPVSQKAILNVKNSGAKIRTVSRWFNAISVEADAESIVNLKSLPEVKSVRLVKEMKHPQPISSEEQVELLLPKSSSTVYGNSYTQLNNMQVIALHDIGVSGYGVLIGLLDDGFNNYRIHPALKDINVVADSDFIHNLGDVDCQPWEDPGQGEHGAGVLSVIGGFHPGKIVGAAYDASFILAKTEMDSSGNMYDFQSEEDTYVAALEWMERMGVDITSSSLGYREFWNSSATERDTLRYNFQALDGNTTLVAQAARIATRKGVLVVTAMGNEGSGFMDSTIVSPADADSIIAVGATYPNRYLAYFSSCGPTADRRIKPDVVAQGTSVYCSDGSSNGYKFGSGTSYSTPLVAGAAALVLSAHPYLTNMQVRDALLKTAIVIDDGTKKTSSYPNNYYGYGFVNALNAALYYGPVFSNTIFVELKDTVYNISIWIMGKDVNPMDSVYLYYRNDSEYKRIGLLYKGNYKYENVLPLTEIDSSSIGYVCAYDSSGNVYYAPYDTSSPFHLLSQVKALPKVIPDEFVLYQNYPNPFNTSTNIRIEAPSQCEVELAVYDILGRKIITIYKGTIARTRVFQWDGTNSAGIRVASGIYISQLKTPNGVISKKMLYLK